MPEVPITIQVLIIFLLGVIVGGFLPRLGRKEKNESKVLQLDAPSDASPKESILHEAPASGIIAQQKERKEANKRVIMAVLEGKTEGNITEEEIEELLNVSDATVMRYLEELEKEGKIVKVETSSGDIHYEKAV